MMSDAELNMLRRSVRKTFFSWRDVFLRDYMFRRAAGELAQLNHQIADIWSREVLGVRGVGSRPSDEEFAHLGELARERERIRAAITAGCPGHNPQDAARLVERDILRTYDSIRDSF